MSIPLSDPKEFGFSAERLERINTTMGRYVDQNMIAGIITLVARRGSVVHLEKVGWQNVESRTPMEFNTIFRIYSMTKPITSIALMMLFEQNLVRLEDPVSKYIPEFNNLMVQVGRNVVTDPDREITVHDLLTHTTGLSYGDDQDSEVDKLYRQADIFDTKITLKEMIHRIAKLPLRYQPGEKWCYSVATDVVGYLVEVIADKPLGDFFQEEIFNPLGIVDTSFTLSPEKMDRLATLYGPTEKGPLEVLSDDIGGDYLNANLHSGGAGLAGTTTDYLRIATLILNKGDLDGVRLLGPKTMELMASNHLPPSLIPYSMSDIAYPGFGFGLGFNVIMDVALSGMMGSVGAHGWGGYANTHFWVDPVEKIVGILMMQYLPSGTYPVTNDFRTLVYQALLD